MGSEKVHKQAYEFLMRHAKAKTSFTYPEIAAAVTSWKKVSTWTTYVSKQLRDYVERNGDRWSVKPTFEQLSYDDYRGGATQVRFPVPKWTRWTYDKIVSYEFLLPLTREDKLRSALDRLFYREELEKRTREFTESERRELNAVMKRADGEADDAYGNRVVEQLATLIGGYSISHVSGRFRVPDNVVSRIDAAKMFVKQDRYLIDETTAVVRFIVRCPHSKVEHGEGFDPGKRADATNLDEDVQLIRTLFFLYFVEAVARTIQGEEVIWLLENSPQGERLYAWEKVAQGARAQDGDGENEETTQADDLGPASVEEVDEGGDEDPNGGEAR